MKIIPVYLPQFHTIPENDKWWGKGFTEWTNVRSAKPLFEKHYQPRVPLAENYYDLSNIETLKWQCEIARKYGIYGFCFYHYWFNGKLLLEKPMEMLLANSKIDINYCISWANHDWNDGWKASAGNEKILIGHDFNDESDWEKHFEYLLQFFKDPRYICEDNKPLMAIYIPNIITKLNKMLIFWDELAKEAGFDGIKFLYQSAMSHHSKGWDRSMFDYAIEFEPGFSNYGKNIITNFNLIKFSHVIKKFFGIKKSLKFSRQNVKIMSYDDTWKRILNKKPSSSNSIPSGFVDWDNTPRKQKAGTVYLGASPKKFKKYFKELILKTKNEYKSDKIFLFAWNEWAEGGYLEPDSKFGFDYLNSIYESLLETNMLSEK